MRVSLLWHRKPAPEPDAGTAPGGDAAPPYVPVPDNQLFPTWERWNKAGWVVVTLGVVIAGFYFVVWPKLKPTPEEAIARRMTPPVRVTSENSLSMDPAIAPDGSALAYASDEGGHPLSIWYHPLSGGAPLRLTSDENHAGEPDFSPDGGRVVYRTDTGVFTVSTSGGPPKQIAMPGRRPRVSPDGKWVVFYTVEAVRGDGIASAGALYLVPSGGGLPRRLQAAFSHAQAPVWSSDSLHILFDGTDARGASDWWVTTVDDASAIRTGAALAFRDAVRIWSTPDAWRGNRVYFSAARGEDLDLWEVAISPKDYKIGGQPSRLTTGKERRSQFTIGGEGRVAYATVRSTVDVFTAPFDAAQGKVTGELKRLTEGGKISRLPSVSRKGDRMAYVSNRSGMQDLWVADLSGDIGVSLSSFQPISYRPVLSADGQKAVFSTIDGGKCRVMLVDVESRQRLLQLEGCNGIWDWSPDSRYLMTYQSVEASGGSIGLLDMTTGDRTEMLAHPDLRLFAAKFSPDGRWVAFAAGPHAQNTKLYVVPFRDARISSSEWIEVLGEPASLPTWTPNGQILVFRSKRDGFDCLWGRRLSAARQPDGDPFPVLHLHRASSGLFRLPVFDFGMSFAEDRLVLNLVGHSGIVWTSELRN